MGEITLILLYLENGDKDFFFFIFSVSYILFSLLYIIYTFFYIILYYSLKSVEEIIEELLELNSDWLSLIDKLLL